MGAASSLSQAMVLGANASSSAIAAATTFQTMQIGAISAGLTSAASTIAVGAVNGRVDGKALVQNVLMSAATGGITAGATQAAGLSNISKLEGVDKTMAIAQKVGISTGVGTALDMAVHGKTSKDVLGRLATSTALALGQNAIGDVAVARGLDEGSLGKTIAHAAVGGALGGTAGAIGGAVSEQMSAHLIDTKDAAGGAKIGLTAATVTMLTGGDVKDMSVASATAASAHEYNAAMHIVRAGVTVAEEEALVLLGETAIGVAAKNVGDKLTQSALDIAVDLIFGTIIPTDTKPQVNSTPIHEPDNKPIVTPVYDGPNGLIETYPAEDDYDRFRLPGFTPAPALPQLPGFSIYSKSS